MTKLTILTKDGCGFCDKVKQRLVSLNIDHETLNIETDIKGKELFEGYDFKTVPQIMVGIKLFIEGGWVGLDKLKDEDLLDKVDNYASTSNLTTPRNHFKPFQYQWAYDAYLRHEQGHWLKEEARMTDDVSDWKNKLNENDKIFLTNVFRFFTAGDQGIASAYFNNYIPYFKHPELTMMLGSFANRENIHVDAYSHLIETLNMPDNIYQEFMDYKEMVDKHNFLHDYFEEESDPIEQRYKIATDIAVFSAFIEGVQLFSSFVMLLNYGRQGLMRGMNDIIEWSMVDETTHYTSMIQLFHTYIDENPELWNDKLKGRIYSVANKIVELENNFIDICFGEQDDMRGLLKTDLKQYIQFITDSRLNQLGLNKIFNVEYPEPLTWVRDTLSLGTHTNFFEQRVTDYSKAKAKDDSNENVWGNGSKGLFG